MAERCEVVIIGAGVVGASVAFHLARMGQAGILLLEREALPGCGSTARANGGIRAQFTTGINVSMSLASMQILDALAGEIGAPPVYRKAGYLFLSGDEARFKVMAEAAAFQRSLGVDVAVLDGGHAGRLAPYAAGPIVGGTFGRRDGFIDPGALLSFLLGTAIREGARARYGVEVVGLEREPGAGFRVHTAAGELRTGAVVNAAGAWAAPVAGFLGVDLPVVPVRRHIVVTGPCAGLPPVIPMTIDADTGVLVRREGNRVVVAYSNPDEPAGFETTFDPEFIARIVEPLESRFPVVAAAGVDFQRSWAGLYEVTPDHHAVIGEAPGVPGFFLANGFSGHGVMHAPAAGRCVAELIVRGRSDTVDVSPLALDRFARNAAIHEHMVL